MLKFFLFFLFSLLTINLYANENLLTIQQQIERLQREVSDLSQTVFSNKNNTSENQISNLSAIDMRIYDLEKDIKNLTGNIEEILFQIDDLGLKIKNFEEVITTLNKSLFEIKNNPSNQIPNQKNEIEKESDTQKENSLGSLNITSKDEELEIDSNTKNINNNLNNKNEEEKINLSPEDLFQTAFDDIRNKNWKNAKVSFEDFINNYPDNPLSGSAHYWLGELHILDKKYREAAIVFTEGHQKFPASVKAPDMLFKLSDTLLKMDKKRESCKILEKLILEYPKNKFIKTANKQLQENNCLDETQ